MQNEIHGVSLSKVFKTVVSQRQLDVERLGQKRYNAFRADIVGMVNSIVRNTLPLVSKEYNAELYELKSFQLCIQSSLSTRECTVEEIVDLWLSEGPVEEVCEQATRICRMIQVHHNMSNVHMNNWKQQIASDIL